MKSDRIVKRRGQVDELAHYKKLFAECRPYVEAVNRLNDAFIQGVAHERTRILTATKDLTYES